MAMTQEQIIAQMMMDLGNRRREEISTPPTDSRGQSAHINEAAQDAIVKKARQQHQQKVDRLAGNNAINNAIRAWNVGADIETDDAHNKLIDRWGGQGHRVNNARYGQGDDDYELLVNQVGEERAMWQSQRRVQQAHQQFGDRVPPKGPSSSRQRAASPRAQGIAHYHQDTLVGSSSKSVSALASRAAAQLPRTKGSAQHQQGTPVATSSRSPFVSVAKAAAALPPPHHKRKGGMSRSSRASSVGSSNIGTRPRDLLKMMGITFNRGKPRFDQPEEDVQITSTWQSFSKAPSSASDHQRLTTVKPPITTRATAKVVEDDELEPGEFVEIKQTTSDEKPDRIVGTYETASKTAARGAVEHTQLAPGTVDQLGVQTAKEAQVQQKHAIVTQQPATGDVANTGGISNSSLTFAKLKAAATEGMTLEEVHETVTKIFDVFRRDWLKSHPHLLEAFRRFGALLRTEMFQIALFPVNIMRKTHFLNEFGFIPDITTHLDAAISAPKMFKARDTDTKDFYEQNSHYHPFYIMAEEYCSMAPGSVIDPAETPAELLQMHVKHIAADQTANSSKASDEYVTAAADTDVQTFKPRCLLDFDVVATMEENCRLMIARSDGLVKGPIKRHGIFKRS